MSTLPHAQGERAAEEEGGVRPAQGSDDEGDVETADHLLFKFWIDFVEVLQRLRSIIK